MTERSPSPIFDAIEAAYASGAVEQVSDVARALEPRLGPRQRHPLGHPLVTALSIVCARSHDPDAAVQATCSVLAKSVAAITVAETLH